MPTRGVVFRPVLPCFLAARIRERDDLFVTEAMEHAEIIRVRKFELPLFGELRATKPYILQRPRERDAARRRQLLLERCDRFAVAGRAARVDAQIAPPAALAVPASTTARTATVSFSIGVACFSNWSLLLTRDTHQVGSAVQHVLVLEGAIEGARLAEAVPIGRRIGVVGKRT